MAKRRSVLKNTCDKVYDQIINGKRYTLKPGESMTLPRYEAVMVRGHYCGANSPVSITLTHLADVDTVAEVAGIQTRVYVAPDGLEFKSKQGLLAHMRSVKKGKYDDTESDPINMQESVI